MSIRAISLALQDSGMLSQHDQDLAQSTPDPNSKIMGLGTRLLTIDYI